MRECHSLKRSLLQQHLNARYILYIVQTIGEHQPRLLPHHRQPTTSVKTIRDQMVLVLTSLFSTKEELGKQQEEKKRLGLLMLLLRPFLCMHILYTYYYSSTHHYYKSCTIAQQHTERERVKTYESLSPSGNAYYYSQQHQ